MYLLVSHRSEQEQASKADEWLNSMAKSFPSLGFVVLAGEYRDQRREYEDYRDLSRIKGFAID